MASEKNRFYLCFCAFTLLYCGVYAQQFPSMASLSSRDQVFMQYMQDVENAYKQIARKTAGLSPGIYEYTAVAADTLMTVAARCSLPYETIATINRLAGLDSPVAGKKLYLPTVPGLYVALEPRTVLEELLYKKTFDFDSLPCYTINGSAFYFLQNQRLTPTERAFFLDTGLRSPLPQGILTSSYGTRISPITGIKSFHAGIDLAAPLQTTVFSCKAGTVKKTGYDSVYGNYIILAHENKSESFYAHLFSIAVSTGQTVARGVAIGKVGTTGASTGPHLHFEVRIDGMTKNPGSLF